MIHSPCTSPRVKGRISLKKLRLRGDGSVCLNLEKSRAAEAGSLSLKSGQIQDNFFSSSHWPTGPPTWFWDQVHSNPKTKSWQCTLPFQNTPLPLCFWLAEQIRSHALWSTIRYCSEQAGTCFQKAAGLGDHVSLLDTINWVTSQSCNEDKFWCLLKLSWEMQTHQPKSHRGRENRTDLLCLSGPHGHQINGQCHGTPLWTDLQFFSATPEAPRCQSPSPRVPH